MKTITGAAVAAALSCVLATSAQAALQWVPAADGQVPPGAVIGGAEQGRQLPVCRASHQNNVYPGKVVAKNCNISWRRREILVPRYEVLVAPPAEIRWVPAANGQVPPGAVIGGSEQGHPLPVCRAQHQNGMHPGKLVAGICNIGWGGRELHLRSYEVMVTVATAAAPVPGPAGVLATSAQAALQWVPAADGKVPPGAVIGGAERGRQLPVCRAPFRNGIYPGKIVAKNCNIGWRAGEITIPRYEVLVAPPAEIRWVPAVNGQVPPGAVIGGKEPAHGQDPGRPLPVCRAPYQGGMHPGKIVGRNCSIGWGGKEITIPRYEVLVAPAAAAEPPSSRSTGSRVR